MDIIPLIWKERFGIYWRSSRMVIRIVIIDQIIKWWLISYLKKTPGMQKEMFSFLDLTYVWNHGISFGFLSQYYQYSNWAFLAINIAIVIFLFRILLRSSAYYAFLGYSMVIGGALGNIIDRIYRGAVFDYIHLHYKGFSLPVFNFADSMITIGAALIAYDYFIASKTQREITDSIKPTRINRAREMDDIISGIK